MPWSSEEQEKDHQVLWKIREIGPSGDGIIGELNLAVVVEYQNPFQAVVEVEANTAFGRPCFSTPWAKDDPLLFDGITGKGTLPPTTDFDTLTEANWAAFIFASHAMQSARSNSDTTISSTKTKSTGELEATQKAYRIRGIPFSCTPDELSIALQSYLGISGPEGVLIRSFTNSPYRHEKAAIVSFPDLETPFESATEHGVQIFCKYTGFGPEDSQSRATKGISLVVDCHFRGFTALGLHAETPKQEIE